MTRTELGPSQIHHYEPSAMRKPSLNRNDRKAWEQVENYFIVLMTLPIGGTNIFVGV